MAGGRVGTGGRREDWEDAERAGARVALAIALLPLVLALVISWAAGNPPWKARPRPPAAAAEPLAPADLGPPGPSPPPHGHP